TLERMGITQPAAYRAALARADALERLDGKERDQAPAAFQGALAIVERTRFARVLDPAAAAALVLSLSAVEPTAAIPRGCAVARWIDGSLRERLAPGAVPESAERLVARAVSGDVPAAPPPVIEWEGFAYRVDL